MATVEWCTAVRCEAAMVRTHVEALAGVLAKLGDKNKTD